MMQVDKLGKALSYALAELHRRGYDTLVFDWKELVFVDPSARSDLYFDYADHVVHI
jgi:hypothetical protein